MTEVQIEKVVEYFNNYISNMTYEDWCSTSSSDWEGMCVGVILDLDLTLYTDEVYDIFDEWYEGIDEDSFKDFN